MTSSPGRTPTASNAKCNAVVPLETAHACGAPTKSANSRSKAATSGPCVTQPERIALSAADTSSGPRFGRATGTKSLDMACNAPWLPIAHDSIFQKFERRSSLAGVPISKLSEAVFERHSGFEVQQFARLRTIREQA